MWKCWFLISGVTTAFLNPIGTRPSAKEQLTNFVIDGSRMSLHSSSRKLGQGSNKHDLDGESNIILEISSSVTRLKAENTGGSAGGQKAESPSEETKLLRIFKILSYKCL